MKNCFKPRPNLRHWPLYAQPTWMSVFGPPPLLCSPRKISAGANFALLSPANLWLWADNLEEKSWAKINLRCLQWPILAQKLGGPPWGFWKKSHGRFFRSTQGCYWKTHLPPVASWEHRELSLVGAAVRESNVVSLDLEPSLWKTLF